LDDKQKNALDFVQGFLDKYGSTGVQEAIDTAVFQLLRYITVFPGGVGKLTDSQGRVLPDCFLMSPGTTAYEFAGKIHTDLATNFVAAIDVKTRRKIGRDTVLKNRDVVEILTSK
jgi:ribosome-binding ATPase YchF (GTP1/OBG family)